MTNQINTSNTIAKKDIYQYVTDTIIAQLEAGTAPWQKPWVGGDSDPFRIPVNAKSQKAYQGVNILLLWCSTFNNEYSSNQWCTFKQWSDQKESIRKGEKGSIIVYYDTFEKEVDGEIKKIPFMKGSIVFNRCQLNSYDPSNEITLPSAPLAERLDKVEQFVTNTKAAIEHTGSRACFVPNRDLIRMPTVNSFVDTEQRTATEGYYGTLLHELTHWSGHSKRLDRKIKNTFGNVQYAEEELIAEIGAAFLCAELEISNSPKEQHASYLANWLTVLKDNKHAIVSAASSASKAVEYLKRLQPTN